MNYKNNYRSFVLLACGVFMSACSTAKVNLLPGAGGSHKIITTARKEHEAYQASHEKAEEHCKLKGKTYAVVSEKSEYLGYDKKTKETVQAVGIGADILRSLASTSKSGRRTIHSSSAGRGASMDTNEDYRVTMTFKCE